MDINDLNPKEYSKAENKDLAVEAVSINRDNLQSYLNAMTYPTTDEVLANEEKLATFYRPVVKTGTKKVDQNTELLTAICAVLENAAYGQVMANHGTLTNVQNTILEKTNGVGSTRASQIDSNLSGRTGSTPARGSLPPVAINDTVPSSTPMVLPSMSDQSLLAAPSLPPVSTINPVDATPPTVTVASVAPTVDKIDFNPPILPPVPIQTGGPPPGVTIIRDCPTGMGMRPVHFANGFQACLGDDGNLYDASCCKPTPPPSPLPCVDVSSMGGGGGSPPPGGGGPGLGCPRPTVDCPDGYDWYWNTEIQQWQCTLGGTKPIIPPKELSCNDLQDKIALSVSVECHSLPKSVKDKLKECGWDMCTDIDKITKGTNQTLTSFWDELQSQWDMKSGLPEQFTLAK